MFDSPAGLRLPPGFPVAGLLCVTEYIRMGCCLKHIFQTLSLPLLSYAYPTQTPTPMHFLRHSFLILFVSSIDQLCLPMPQSGTYRTAIRTGEMLSNAKPASELTCLHAWGWESV